MLLDGARARLAVLAGDAANAHRRHACCRLEHRSHLHDELDLRRGVIGVAVDEALGAVTALDDELVAAGALREERGQIVNLVRCHERR